MIFPPSQRDVVEAIADSFLARYRAGEAPRIDDFANRVPDLADQLREYLASLVRIEKEATRPSVSNLNNSGMAAGSIHEIRIGDYRILREIGRGGMGVVYEAEQVSLGRRVALKVLPAHVAGDRKSLERFRREAKASACLHHTNIVPVFEVGRDGHIAFYAMQFIEGQSLDLVIKQLVRYRENQPAPAASVSTAPPSTLAQTATFHPRVPATVSPIPTGRITRESPDVTAELLSLPTGVARLERATDAAVLPGEGAASTLETSSRSPLYRSVAEIGQQVAQGLAFAHERGIVHRDVKPSNLIMDKAGVVWIADFGLAKAEDDGLTETGDILGTLRYMAPERFRGEGDARADVYSLGLTLYELLTLKPAHLNHDRLALIESIQNQEPPRPRLVDRRIPLDLETIVLKAIEKDPKRRYPSAAALAEDLRHFLRGEPISARRSTEFEKVWKWTRRHPGIAAMGAALALCLLAGSMVSTLFAFRSERFAQEARKSELQAIQSRNASARLAAGFLLDEGIRRFATEGESEGLLWMAESLELASGIAHDLALLIRENLASWSARLFDLKYQIDTGNKVRIGMSRDGSRFATASDDKSVRIWDTETGRALTPPLIHGDEVNSVGFDPQGQRIVTACNDKLVRIWDVKTGAQLVPPMKHADWVLYAEFSPDGTRVVSASEDTTGRIWDARTGEPVGSPLKHKKSLEYATFSPDGKLIATTSFDKTARIWDASTGSAISPPLRHEDKVLRAAFNLNGTRLVTASKDRTARVWYVETGDQVLPPLVHFGQVNTAVFSGDGRFVLTSCDDGTAVLWSAETGQLVHTYKGHRGSVLSASFSPDERRIVTSSQDQSAAIWERETGERLGTLMRHRDWVYQARFHPNGRTILTSSRDFTVRAWDVSPEPALSTPLEHPPGVNCASYSHDGKQLATGSVDGSVRIWDLATRRCVLTAQGQSGVVHFLEFTPDGKKLLVAGAGRKMRALDTSTGAIVTEFVGHTDSINTVFVDGRGLHAVTASDDGLAIVWDVATGRRLVELKGSGKVVRSATFSPDGERIITACTDRTAQVWNARNGKPIGEPLRHSTDVTWAEFSSDGRRIVTAAQENFAYLWDMDTGRPTGRALRHDSFVDRARFSPDGTRVLTGSRDGKARLWDSASGRPAGPPIPVGGIVWSAAFRPDGIQILLVGGGKDVIVTRQLTPPMLGTPSEVRDRLERLTGLRRTEDGDVKVLDGPALDTLSRKLRFSPGNPD